MTDMKRFIKMSFGLEELVEQGFSVRLKDDGDLGPTHAVVVTGPDGSYHVLAIWQDDSNANHFRRKDFDAVLGSKP